MSQGIGDFFRILGAGASFRRQPKRDTEKAKRTEEENDDADDQIGTNSNQDPVQIVAPELDFFDTSKSTNGSNSGNKSTQKKRMNGGSSDSRQKRRRLESDDLENKLSTEMTEDAVADDDEEQESEEAPESVDFTTFRKRHKIRVYGSDIPNPIRNFQDLFERFKLRNFLQQNISKATYSEPTPIQMQAIPILLHGREILGCAPTGSGKTLAFVLPILQELKAPAKSGFRAVIVSPTRELAQQIYRECKKLCTGKNFKMIVLSKAASHEKAAEQFQSFDILITTPLVLVHAIQSDTISLKNVLHLVLDEADKLLEGGFLEQVDEILAACTHPQLRKALFSATMPSSVEALAKTFMADPIRVVIGSHNAATESITQSLMYVGQEEGKLVAIRQMVTEGKIKPPVLIFVQSIDRAKELFRELVYDGINVDVIHAERTKSQRDAIVTNFRAGKVWVLIATDIISRGVDFKGVNLVINYDFPQSSASYIHRIGRTGRAGRKGEAVTFFTKDDAPYLKMVVNVMRESGCEVPQWMLELKGQSHKERQQLAKKAVERRSISTVSKYDERKAEKKREMIEASKRRHAKRNGKSFQVETQPV